MTRFLFAVLLVGLAGLVFFQFTQPVLDEISLLRQEKTRLEAGLENAKKLREVEEQLLSVYNSFAPADLVKLDKLLPDNIDTVRLVIDVNTIAERSGLKIKNIRIQMPEKEAAAALGGGGEGSLRPTPAAARPALGGADLGTAILGFSVTGPYTNFQSFLSDLAKSLRLVDVSTLHLTPPEEGPYQYNVEVQTYWLK